MGKKTPKEIDKTSKKKRRQSEEDEEDEEHASKRSWFYHSTVWSLFEMLYLVVNHRHKLELDELRDKDPEFYEFLQENDADLLDFEGEDAEQEFDAFEDEGEPNARGVKVLNSDLLSETLKRARSGTLKDIRQLLLMFKAASNPNVDNDDDNGDGAAQLPYSISSPEVYEEVMTSVVQWSHVGWRQFLQVKSLSKPKVVAHLAENAKWKRLQPCVLSFFSTILSLLQSIGVLDKHHEVAMFIINSLENYIPFLGPLPRLTRNVAKALCGLLTARINDSPHNDDSTHEFSDIRSHCLLRLRQIALLLPGNAGEECFRLVYLSFARACKSCSELNADNIAFVTRCVAELYKSDPAMAYQQAFLYIRQLALHLRTAFINKGEKSANSIRSWQYVHCVRLWTTVISSMPSHDNGLGTLIYPLTQIIQGVLVLLPSPYVAPLRFHLIACCHTLAKSGEAFIPCAFPLLELLDYPEFLNKPVPSTEAPPKLQYLVTLPPNAWRKKAVREVILQEIVKLIRDEIDIYRHHSSFLEYAFIIQRRLRSFLKNGLNERMRELVKVLLDKVNDRFLTNQQASDDRPFPHQQLAFSHSFISTADNAKKTREKLSPRGSADSDSVDIEDDEQEGGDESEGEEQTTSSDEDSYISANAEEGEAGAADLSDKVEAFNDDFF